MLEDVNNLNSNILNSALNNNAVSNVSSVSSNPYTKETEKVQELIDKGEISDEAIKKYEAEAEIAKYQSLVLEMLKEDENSEKVTGLSDLIMNNEYNIDNQTLADAIFEDEDAQNLLF